MSRRDFEYDVDKFMRIKQNDNRGATLKECLRKKRFWYPIKNKINGFGVEKLRIFFDSLNI